MPERTEAAARHAAGGGDLDAPADAERPDELVEELK